LLTENIPPIEGERILRFLEATRNPLYTAVFSPSFSLSSSDQSTLSWAIQNRADWLLADERLLRRIAREQGIPVVGFCGLLVQAAKIGLLSAEEVRADIDTAISDHRFRISIRLYQRLLGELGGE
jgi:predicted nucleic acid-binding protein